MHVAVVGSGQLARMMAQAGAPLGIRFSFIAEPNESADPVDGFGQVYRLDAYLSPSELLEAVGSPDVITVEKEAVDAAWLNEMAEITNVYPRPNSVWSTQNRIREKQLLESLGISTAPYSVIQPGDDVHQIPEKLGYPFVIKTAEEGYDGKGQWRIKDEADLKIFEVANIQVDCIAEAFINFDCEVSMIGARSASGQEVFYALTQNKHTNGILLSSLAPAPDLSPLLPDLAKDYLTRLLDGLDYVGVLSMECFVQGDSLMVNELAPRVHNSGHWTQQGSATSQFENHLRAILDMPLGSTELLGYAGMLNLLGIEPVSELLNGKGTLHGYNKSQRPGRKMGHINLVSQDGDDVLEELKRLEGRLYPPL